METIFLNCQRMEIRMRAYTMSPRNSVVGDEARIEARNSVIEAGKLSKMRDFEHRASNDEPRYELRKRSPSIEL